MPPALPDPATIRPATAQDAEVIAAQRGPVVAGVGVMVHPESPTLSAPAPRRAYVLNMCVAPQGRRGLAAALMHAALERARACGLRSVTLHAAPMGRRLYEQPGFTGTRSPEMRLTLGDPA